jgi:MFS family permease
VLAYLVREFSMDIAPRVFPCLRIGDRWIALRFLGDRTPNTRADGFTVYSTPARHAHSPTPFLSWDFGFVLGLGMGGEWTTAGRGLQTRRAEYRGKALGLMQSAYAIGEAVAALVVAVVLHWLARVFRLPHSSCSDSQPRPRVRTWQRRTTYTQRAKLLTLLQGPTLRNGILATAMNSFAMFGYWGLFVWIPGYLSLPVAQGGRGLSLAKTTSFFLILCGGKWLGYALFGFFADLYGRKRPYFAFLLIAALLVPTYGLVHTPLWLLILGPLVGFFGIDFLRIRSHRQ